MHELLCSGGCKQLHEICSSFNTSRRQPAVEEAEPISDSKYNGWFKTTNDDRKEESTLAISLITVTYLEKLYKEISEDFSGSLINISLTLWQRATF